ncbi:peptide deformylase [Candidatus Kaiserbacteria bacterium CG10_big_fil_rev_8_21_14_0_10_45_20]|uniref:Peptide deformylase n=1 Tax=Candidatus Kaiserbacteria bacterium CG10_big_fil_rev_8_21_14_0_10_45_20 TaxID=1974607 RepID=A0A2H0UG56_9BACT|nr:MAG: peptide deformylase [Candidatus Kaiserbacteria bacterium CG10_big_fil_rev_8_21_14_0_10_45_20]
MLKSIVTDGDPVLRKKAVEVASEEFGTEALQTLVQDMSDTLRSTKYGVAIAAPQIGISKRIFVVRGNVLANKDRSDTSDDDVAFINPTLIRRSKKQERFDEGCLSVPHKFGTVVRSEKAVVRAYTASGDEFEMSGEDLLAEIFQHEIDHLEGVLFIDSAQDIYIHEPQAE